MVLTNLFFRKKILLSTTSKIAKERLQIIINKRRNNCTLTSKYLQELKKDLTEVIQKYINNPKVTLIQLKNKDQEKSILRCDIYF